MKVALLANAGSTHTIKLANALHARGLDVRVYTQDTPAASLNPDIPCYCAPYTGGKGYILNALWLRRALALFKPDVLNAHYVSGYGILAALCGYSPVILSVWGSDIYYFPKTSFLHRLIIQFNLWRGSHTHSVSEHLLDAANAIYRRPSSIIPFGVDPAVFYPDAPDPALKTPFKRGDYIIGVCKGLHPVYGHDTVLDALKILLDKKPEMRPRALFVGDGPLRASLEERVRTMGLTPYVYFTGFSEQADIPYYYNILSCYVVASLSEGLCVSAVEAAFCKKPVVATRVGGVPDTVIDNVTGFLIPPQNAPAMAESIARLMDDTALAETIGAQALASAQARFDWNKNVDAFIELYKSISQA